MFLLTHLAGFGGRRGSADPFFSSVSALLHMDGTDASTTFTDVKGGTWTSNGGAQIDTAQSKFGGASGLFDGTDDYLQFTDDGRFDFGTGDYTVEGWFRWNDTSSSGGVQPLFASGATGSDKFTFRKNSATNAFQLEREGTLALVTSADQTINNGQWYHIAVCRSGTTAKMYLDGVEFASGTDSTNWASTTIRIGTNNQSHYFNGWIDDLRITKGVARYTANFTPPTAAFPD